MIENPLHPAQNQSTLERKFRNHALSVEEFSQNLTEIKSMPSKILIELTQNCNFKCIMCPQAYEPQYAKYNPEFNMPLKLFYRIAENLFPDAQFVDLRGFGETVVMPGWPEIVEHLKSYPFINWHLVTNLSLANDRVWEKMIQAGFILGFSCDGATAKTYEGIRINGNFKKTIHNLELISETIHSTQMGQIYFISTLQKKNIFEVTKIIELARRYSIKEVQFKIARTFGNSGFTPELLTPDDLEKAKPRIEIALRMGIEAGIQVTFNQPEFTSGLDTDLVQKASISRKGPEKINFPPTDTESLEILDRTQWKSTEHFTAQSVQVSKFKKCFKPFYYTVINQDGRVGTCSHMLTPNILEMGNLNYQDFEEIWNGPDYRFFRQTLTTENPLDPRCQWCFQHRIED